MAQQYDPAITAPPPNPEPVENILPDSNSAKPAEIIETPKVEVPPATAREPVPERAAPQLATDSKDLATVPTKVVTPKVKLKEDPNGLRSTKAACDLHEQPDGKKISTLRADKRVWTDDYNGQWYKVYRKAGFAFAKKSCF